MKFAPVPTNRVPKQDAAKVMLLADRWQRATFGHSAWAERAKKAFDMFEGRQYTVEQLAKARNEKRPALTFNIIAPLVRLVLGYQRNNKSDITFQAGQDALSLESTAEALTMLEKQIAQASDLPFIDTEVFLDGLVGGRGFFDTRLDFEDNDLGEAKTTAMDPFRVKIDPNADSYDLNATAGFLSTERMVSIDEIEDAFGKAVAELMRPFMMGQTPLAPLSTFIVNDEITPVRAFAESDELAAPWWDNFYALNGDFVDTYRKTIRVVEMQYKCRKPKNVIIDLETGMKKILPDHWDRERLQKVLLYCQQIGNPCVIERRNVELFHWTTMAGDLLLYDAESMYDRYTITGYFPYFRRGMTRGMVDDMIDPQLEKNKRKSAKVEIVSKTANGGWIYHEKALTAEEERKLQKFGSTPGVRIKFKGDASMKPEQIKAEASTLRLDQLEQEADQDIRTISGVNESALGELDRVQSGRAIEARQRQAVMSIQVYMDNFKRSKQLLGGNHLSIIQNYYTEPRIYRVLGEDSRLTKVMLNMEQVDPANGIKRILNDVTIGKYSVVVDDAPLSATFLNAQFEEMMLLLEKMGPAIGPQLPMFADLIVEMSTLPRKDEWVKRFQMVAQGLAGGGQPGAPGGAPPGLPAPAPGGAPAGANVVPFDAATQPRRINAG
ncbi:MAG: portal protein [Variibacter sp.]